MKTNDGARRMRKTWRLGAALAVAVSLGGCLTASGPSLSTMATATAGGPPKGMARIVVLRGEQSSFVMRGGGFPIKLDGEPLGEVAVGTFAYLDRPAGAHQISAEIWGYPGVTRHDFTAIAGRTYYFRASLNEKANDVAAVTMISPIGGMIAASATYNDRQGPIDLTLISEVEAKQAMAAARAAGQ
jgi:hypothetical protein